ncbi:MAG TPA: NADP-dependent phosphogluconate dehydrogenase [Frankiaceae bacterium]|nr:NADP-dependent phosphogluconate dehydrogenase [Frankiaceae bacterium]
MAARDDDQLATIGLTGLAVMGQNLARNIAAHGYPIVVHNRTQATTDAFIEGLEGDDPLTATDSMEDFVARLERPRKIILMVKAGAPVDGVLDELLPLLDEGDIVIDGGNSFFQHTERRQARCQEQGIHFLGVGISGGEEGALHGPSIMPGGNRDAYAQVEEILTSISAHVDGEPCCRYIGAGGAGHYVKMVHNGIEYADIQLIVESYDLMRHVLGRPADELATVFEQWNEGDLESFLIEITSIVLAKQDPDTGQPLVDVILDQAEQKGTGRWTAQDALELGVPSPSMTTAVYARSLSALKDKRERASSELSGPDPTPADSGDAADRLIDDIRQALYASKVVAYAEGFDQLATASRTNDWNLDLGALATIWRGGCIIRARFLNRIRDSYADRQDVDSLLVLPYFRDELAKAQDAWRRAVSTGIANGVPVPAFSAALGYYDGYRQARGPANLIQGLRDYFGAHTYRRTDREGAYHVRWGQDGSQVEPGKALKDAAGH